MCLQPDVVEQDRPLHSVPAHLHILGRGQGDAQAVEAVVSGGRRMLGGHHAVDERHLPLLVRDHVEKTRLELVTPALVGAVLAGEVPSTVHRFGKLRGGILFLRVRDRGTYIGLSEWFEGNDEI